MPFSIAFCSSAAASLFDLSVILGQVVSEPEAGLWSKFLIITVWEERLENLMSKTCSHSELLLTQKEITRGITVKERKKSNLMEHI